MDTPKNRDELIRLIEERITQNGYACSLNDIDVSNVKDMSYLFYQDFKTDHQKAQDLLYNALVVENPNIEPFQISGLMEQHIKQPSPLWNMAQQEVASMIRRELFTGDISKWNTASLIETRYMFYGSSFNGDISNWDVSKVECMHEMFNRSSFQGDLSKWKIHPQCIAWNALTVLNDSPLGVLCMLNESIAHPTKHSWYPTFKEALALTENLNMPMVDAAYYIYDCLHPRAPELVLPDETWMTP